MEKPRKEHLLDHSALTTALKKLGYTPYDFVDRMFLGHMPVWDDALRAKFFGQGTPWGRNEFDGVFKGFDVSSNSPVPSLPIPYSRPRADSNNSCDMVVRC